jgi:hypothetical protein
MGTTATRRSIMTYCGTGPPMSDTRPRRLRQRQHPGVVARGVVDGDGLGAGADRFGVTITRKCSTSCLIGSREMPPCPTWIPARRPLTGNPAAAGSFPASRRLRR